jgi:hypothetical protein
MRNGVTSPRVKAAIWLLVTIGCVAMIWTGAADMNRLGRETWSTGLRIVLGIIGAGLGAMFTLLAVKAMRVLSRARRHQGEIARWTVPARDLDGFRENDAARGAAGRRNDLRLPSRSPEDGLEVVFLDDHVLVGDRIFGLVTTGMYRFSSVRIVQEKPLSIEFDLTWTTLSAAGTLSRAGRVLRIPIATLARAEAVKVYNHFRAVAAREVVVNPDLHGRRIRFAAWALLVSIAAAAAGFAMNRPHMSPDEMLVPLTLAVAGSVCAVGAGIFMLIALGMRRDQRQGGGGGNPPG